MIRVFPRKTSWTPTDDLAFIGMPKSPIGLRLKYGHLPVHISVTFTWDIPLAEMLYRAWLQVSDNVQLGGPAFGDPGGEFTPGRYVREGITFTSRGCSKQCPHCLVPSRCGGIRELLVIHPGNNVADDNVLDCSEKHQKKVFAMLRAQKEVSFSGGLDAEKLQDWHIDELMMIRFKFLFFACDRPGAIEHLWRIAPMLKRLSSNQQRFRCYVLIGHGSESITQAERRLKEVYRAGFDPFAMLYQEPEMKRTVWPKDWKALTKVWTRPAIYHGIMKNDQSANPPPAPPR